MALLGAGSTCGISLFFLFLSCVVVCIFFCGLIWLLQLNDAYVFRPAPEDTVAHAAAAGNVALEGYYNLLRLLPTHLQFERLDGLDD